MASGQFTSSGHTDLVETDYYNGTVTVFLGNGDGTFQAGVTYAVGNYPIDVVVGDFGNGHADLAVTNTGDGTVSVLLGNGDGTFLPAATYAVGNGPNYLTAADLTGSGTLDLVVANENDNTVSILMGNGDGTFGSAITLADPGSGPVAVAVGNVTGGPTPDLVVANSNSNTVTVFPGTGLDANGLPTYGTPVSYATGVSPIDVKLGKFRSSDSNPLLDIATANSGDNTVSILLNNGDGTFPATPSASYSTGGNYPQRLVTYTTGNNVNLAVANYDSSNVGVLLGNGDGTFQPAITYASSYDPRGLTVGDFNGDGIPDLVSADWEGNRLTLLTGQQAQPLTEDPAGSGLRSAFGRGALTSNSDADYFSFTGNAGDLLTIASAIPGNPYDSGLAYFVFAPNGNQIGYLYSTYYGGYGQAGPFTLATTGTYYLRVSPYYGYYGEYDFRVTLAPSATIQEGSQSNNSIGNASPVTLTLSSPGHIDAAVAGAISTGDSGDYYQLGNLTPGSTITLTPTLPSTSTLSPILALYNSAGTQLAVSNPGDTSLSYSVTSEDIYYVEVSAANNTAGLLSQYLVKVDVSNTTSPTVTAPGLPAEGGTTSTLFNQLILAFSTVMTASTVNDVVDNYVLQDSSGNTYQLASPSYTSGSSATFAITNGPLQPGNYTLTVSGLTDRFGNTQLPFTLSFTVAALPGFTTQGPFSDNPATPTALTLIEDPAGSGLSLVGGRGTLHNNSDTDYWTFSGTANNLLTIDTQNPNSPPGSELTYVVTNPDGTQLTSFATDNYGNAESAPIALPQTGTYTVSVQSNDGYTGEYRFRIADATSPLQLDQEPNNSISTADVLTLTANGNSQEASVAGAILTASDLNYFNLGTIQAGQSILLSTQLPSVSGLNPVVSVYNSAGQYIAKTNGRPFDGVGQIDITTTGTYYALMQGANGTGGVLDQYDLNVQIVPTSSLVQLPNLEVTNISLPTGNNIESGQSITFSWTVTNTGQAATNVANWSDRAVLSLDATYGNSDDIPLSLSGNNGIFPHQGVLQPGQSYTATETVTLPDGISGLYHIIVQTDSTDQVAENAIGRGDSTTVSTGGPSGDGTFNIALSPYPDLTVQGLTVSGPNANGTFTVSWNTVNNGNGAVPNTWNEHLVIQDQTTGHTVQDTVLGFSGGLAANGGTASHTEPISGDYTIDSPGHFLVSITTNSDQSIYEDNAQGHTNAVQNDNSSTTFDATRDLQVAGLTVTSPASPQSGNQITIDWNDTNTGTLATTGSWNDYVTVINTTTGVTLVSNAVVAYNGGAIQPGGQAAQAYTFMLRDGGTGVGSIKVVVTVNANNAEAEHNTTGTAQSNNTSTTTFTSTLANYADLTVQSGSLSVTPSSTQSGSQLTVSWNDENIGDAAVNVGFRDYIEVQRVNADNSLTYITAGAVGGDGTLGVNATSPETFQFNLPDGALGAGNFVVTVTTDYGEWVKEYDSNGNAAYGNNSASTTFTSTLANYADLTVQSGSLSVTPTSTQSGGQVTVNWNDENIGDAAVNTAFTDYVLVQRVNADNSLTYITSGTVSGDSSLQVNALNPETLQFNLPDGAPGTGNFLVTVTTDIYRSVKEYDSNGNAAYGNNSASTTLTSTLADYADLTVQSGSLSVRQPSNLQSGNQVTIGWTDQNIGDAAVSTAFSDYVLVQKVNADQSLTYIASGFVNGDASLGVNATSAQTFGFPLPNGVAGTGDIRITVTTDYYQSVKEYDSNGNAAYGNNTSSIDATSTLAHYADLLVSGLSVNPANGLQSGDQATVSWTDANSGNAAAGAFTDSISAARVNADGSLTPLTSTTVAESGLAASGSIPQSVTLQLPDGSIAVGDIRFTVTTDSGNTVLEYDAQGNPSYANNTQTYDETSTLFPYPDLAVSNVTAPALTIADPATVTIGWTVSNVGAGPGRVNNWTDAVIASPSGSLSDSGNVVLATFPHTGGLAAAASYSQSETFLLPPAFTGRYHLLVETNYSGNVFENGATANDVAQASNLFDVMPVAYSDLVVSKVTVPAQAYGGQPLTVSWTVANQGIGTTNIAEWNDVVYLATNPDGSGEIAGTETDFDHIGFLNVGGSYQQTGKIAVPNGLSGTIYFVVTTAGGAGNSNIQHPSTGPFEFIYTSNDTTVSSALPVSQPPTPDLVVTSVQAPTSAEEGTPIDVTWTVANQGQGTADGAWVDRVYLQEAGNTSAPIVELGQFSTNGPLDPGNSYTRTYQVTIPAHIQDTYSFYVTTDYMGADNTNPNPTVYEGPAGSTAVTNDTTAATQPITVSPQPRPDLQVANIQIPSSVPAGSALSVTFDVINQGTVATNVPHWTDAVYLSLDTTIDPGSVLIGQVGNQSALGSGQEYQSTAGPVIVPERFAGNVYVIVDADYNNQVDQWPNGKYDLVYKQIYVQPQPLPDLVTSDVIVPTQATAGSTIPVTYTVTNLGAGATLVNNWTDTIWLTKTKGRPNPNNGDILLASVPHTGSLDVKAGYDQTVNVTIPQELASGTYYITPWVDPYGVVLQTELAVNTNPDDPTQIQNDNYKNQSIDVLGALPDLVVTSVQGPSQIQAGNPVTITWTVKNEGIADATQSGWGDRVYLSNIPNPNFDPNNPSPNTFFLGQVKHSDALDQGDSYTQSLTVTLSPADQGLYWVVIANSSPAPTQSIDLSGLFGFSPPPPDPSQQFTPLTEVTTSNNTGYQSTDVTPVPADLKITNVSIPSVNYSGESMTFSYTVTNVGQYPVWSGTKSWTDYLWLTADPTFIRMRASYMGAVVTPNSGQLDPGESYTVTDTVTLPQGTGETGSQYYLWIDLDAHNDLSPLFFPYEARQEMTAWWPGAAPNSDPTLDLLSHGPVSGGDNSDLLSFFSDGAYENPTNNRVATPFQITFREATLQVTNLQVPAGVHSGETIPVTYTVTNIGNRATRVSSWTDGIYLATSPSLTDDDTELTTFAHNGVLNPGDSYTATVEVTLPQSIEGDFHLIVYSSSPVVPDPTGRLSDIGFDLVAVVFKPADPLAPWDLVSAATRQLAAGAVAQYEGEGENIASADLPIILTSPPDLQVTALTAPTHATVGGQIDVSWTVTNTGGDTVPGQEKWKDLVYLARDTHLDIKSDIYLGTVDHGDFGNGFLGAGQSYSVDDTFTLPAGLVGPFYVIVVTNPPLNDPRGQLVESNYVNNDRPSDVPVVIDYPPPTDLQVTTITTPASATIGQAVTISWTVTNTGQNPASGTWSDAVYFSPTTTWAVSDPFVGTASFKGTLLPGQSYTETLTADVPSLTPGAYYVIVRADIFDQVYEGTFRPDSTSASPDVVNLSAVPLVLGVPFPTTLNSNQEELFQVDVPAGQTLNVTATAGDATATMQLFASAGVAPTTTLFDASSGGALGAVQTAVVPSTQPGTYYILLDGFTMPNPNEPVTIEAQLVPLTITDVQTDTGGASQYVTTTITGAGFNSQAIVKLVRPGFAEYEPVNYEVVNATEIIAEFDLTGAPHGLYDVTVTNPDGNQAILPYRFLVTQTVEPEVTVGVGGPRYIFAGDTGTYSVTLDNLGNIDAPYTYFVVGVPEMGTNFFLDNLEYVYAESNVHGGPTAGSLQNLPWATLTSINDINGTDATSGYALNLAAGSSTGFTFNVDTYPGMEALNQASFDQLKAEIYKAYPQYAAEDIIACGPQDLDKIYPGLYEIWSTFGGVPNFLQIPITPFQFNIVAAATSLTTNEFVTMQLQEADQLRTAILADPTASTALTTLAADQSNWEDMYLASLEETGILQPSGTAPPISTEPQVISAVATLAAGILAGPAGQQIITDGNLSDFFNDVKTWYGNTPGVTAPTSNPPPSFTSNSLGIFGLLQNANPIPDLPTYSQYNLGTSLPTTFENFNVYVPWVAYGLRSGGIPADYAISGVTPNNTQSFFPLNLDQYYANAGAFAGEASITGPFTQETGGFVPVNQPLPFTVNFQNDPSAQTYTHQIRITVPLDPNVDAETFQLGDIKIGNITIHIPAGRSLYQGDFDFTQSNGFILRVSAGVDLVSHAATWLLQAIDPTTGQLLQNPNEGLLAPNDAAGDGAGYVSYTVEADASAPTGTTLTASASADLDNAPPEKTQSLTWTIDSVAPTTTLTVTPIANTGNYDLKWNAADDSGGSGVASVTLYVAEDGGNYTIWQRDLPGASGEMVFDGLVGHTFQFLALATDVAGNHEQPPAGGSVPDDGSGSNLGSTPVVSTTPPNFGQPPPPATTPSTNPLFTEAQQGIPAAPTAANASEFTRVLAPFQAQAFVTGIGQSEGNIGPMALAQEPDGTFLVSGGPDRNELFHVGKTGGAVTTPLATEPFPIYNLAFDSQGNLWATTGGGPLVQLDPATGDVLGEFGDAVELGLAIDPSTGLIYVGTSTGVDTFNPANDTFTAYSRDLNLRVASLAFDSQGNLWATTWPDRSQVVEFDVHRRAQVMLTFTTPIDSIAFGQAGTSLAGLLFVTHNSGANGNGSDLTMVDVATLQQVAVATGGSRDDAVITTSDGRVLVSQSSQVDVLNPITNPAVLATNPPNQSVVALPLSLISVTFDQDMIADSATDSASVTNPANYTLVGADGVAATVVGVTYDASTRTALLQVQGLTSEEYTLTVLDSITGVNGYTLAAPYAVTFTAVNDVSNYASIKLTDTQLDRATQTLSYEVTITNTADFDLLLPLLLTLDPAKYVQGAPQGAEGVTGDGRWIISLSNNVPGGVELAPGQSTTAYTVQIVTPGFETADYQPGVIGVPADNAVPVFTSKPPTTVTAGQTYSYSAVATDTEGNVVAYLLQQAPAGMTVNASTGVITWATTAQSPAVAPVTLYAFDTRGAWTKQQWTVQVAGGNEPPVLGTLPTTLQITEGQSWQVPVTATDGDGDKLIYWADNLPPGATFSPPTHTFAWTPPIGSAGTYPGVTIYVSDGISTVSQTFTVAVAPADHPPTLTLPPDRTVRQGDGFILYFNGSDPDGGIVTYSSSALPEGAVLDANTGRFEWIVPYDVSGTVAVPVTVTSSTGLTATKTITFTVLVAPGAAGLQPAAGLGGR